MDFSSILGSGGSGGILGMATNLIGGVLGGKKKEQPQQVASAAQQPSIFQNNGSASSGTVKMEIPADKAGQVAKFITQA